MKLVTYNIQYSRGKDDEFDLNRIADAVRDADVICLQEVVRNAPTVPDQDHPARLGELLPDFYWVYGPPVDLDASEKNADGSVVNRRLQFGNMVMARWPILSSRLLLLPKVRTYDVTSAQRGALETIVDLPSGPLRIYSTHLDHLSSRHRIVEIRHLLPRILTDARHGGPVSGPGFLNIEEVGLPDELIIMGDFNMTPGSPEYYEVVGAPDYYYGQVISSNYLVDTWTAAGNDLSQGTSWYDDATQFTKGHKLDYGFVSGGLAAKVTRAWIDDDAPGSDHQPTWFELGI